MNIRQLEAFHAVMETGSTTRAAEKMHISQPAVSKLLKALSDTCGFTLFQRRGGRMEATRDARSIAIEVERLFAGTERIRRLAESVQAREGGVVSIAAPSALSCRYLADVLAPVCKEHPHMYLSIQGASSSRILDLVVNQQIDIGLSMLPFSHPEVISEKILGFSLMCFLPASHPLAIKQLIEIQDLSNEHYISLPRDECSLMTVEHAFQSQGVAKGPTTEVPFSEAACSFVANGAGVSILAPFVGKTYSEEVLVRRPLKPDISMDIWMLSSANRPNSLTAQRIEEILRQRIGIFA